MAVQLTYTGTPFANQIRQQGFRPGGILSVAPGKIFSTTNPAFASTYGTPINLATSTRAFSLPSFNFTSGVSGREVIQSPKAATKGMRLAEMAERLKNVSPTASKLLSGKTVSGLGGGVAAPGILRSLFSLPMAAVTAGPQVISSLMAPRTEAGFDYMKGFDEGAITSIADETAGLDFQDFGTGIMQADAAATQKAALENALIDATPIFASEDIAARNVGVPQDNMFTGIMRNFARGPLFQGGATAGLRLGEIITGAPSLPFALAGGIASQFLPLGRSKPDMDYQYVNDPNNMGGLRVVDNKIVDPRGILSGKNFESAFGSKNLGEMYDKEIGRLDNFITDLEEEEELTDKQKARLGRLQTKKQLAVNALQDYLSSGPTIPGTNITRAQFARDYNQAQQNIGSNYDQLDSQSYESLGGGQQADGSYNDPYDPGTDD